MLAYVYRPENAELGFSVCEGPVGETGETTFRCVNVQDSLAYLAGLRENDVLISCNDFSIPGHRKGTLPKWGNNTLTMLNNAPSEKLFLIHVDKQANFDKESITTKRTEYISARKSNLKSQNRLHELPRFVRKWDLKNAGIGHVEPLALPLSPQIDKRNIKRVSYERFLICVYRIDFNVRLDQAQFVICGLKTTSVLHLLGFRDGDLLMGYADHEQDGRSKPHNWTKETLALLEHCPFFFIVIYKQTPFTDTEQQWHFRREKYIGQIKSKLTGESVSAEEMLRRIMTWDLAHGFTASADASTVEPQVLGQKRANQLPRDVGTHRKRPRINDLPVSPALVSPPPAQLHGEESQQVADPVPQSPPPTGVRSPLPSVPTSAPPSSRPLTPTGATRLYLVVVLKKRGMKRLTKCPNWERRALEMLQRNPDDPETIGKLSSIAIAAETLALPVEDVAARVVETIELLPADNNGFTTSAIECDDPTAIRASESENDVIDTLNDAVKRVTTLRDRIAEHRQQSEVWRQHDDQAQSKGSELGLEYLAKVEECTGRVQKCEESIAAADAKLASLRDELERELVTRDAAFSAKHRECVANQDFRQCTKLRLAHKKKLAEDRVLAPLYAAIAAIFKDIQTSRKALKEAKDALSIRTCLLKLLRHTHGRMQDHARLVSEQIEKSANEMNACARRLLAPKQA